VRVTRYATVRLVTAAVFTVLVVSGTTAWIYAVGAGVDVQTLLLTGALGLVSFGVLVLLLLFDARRRHQLMRVLRSRLASGRLLVRDRGADEEQRAEMKRRLEYALEGLRSAVTSRPAPVPATPGASLFEEGRRSGAMTREAPRDGPTYESAPLLESGSLITESVVRAPEPQRLPVSARVAQGAPLVRCSTARHRQAIDLAAAQTRLTALRLADHRAIRRATLARWVVRAALLLLVPGVLTYQALTQASWFAGVWDGLAGQAGLCGALALGLAGSVWTLRETRQRRGRRLGSATKVESHALRSRFAAEQLALRLALGVAAPEAWRAVAITNHFPVGSAMPADTTEDALVLVEQLRAVARRRRHRPIRRRIALLAAPLITCLLPASVIILLL
jgi:hypothetical protein